MGLPQQQPLFRDEVLAEQQSQWLGTVLLAPRVSFRVFTAFALTAVLGMLGLLLFAEYTAKARINGWLVPDRGVVRVVAPQSGIIVELAVAEGDEVAAGSVLARVSTELRSDTSGATRQQVVERLRERRASTAAERERRERLFAQELVALEERRATMQAELAQLDREIALQTERVTLAAQSLARIGELVARQLTPVARMEEADQDRLDQALRLQGLVRARTVLERETLELAAETRRRPLENETLLAVIDRDVATLDQELAEAEARREVVVVAPVPGIVTGIQVEPGTTIGGAAPLLSLVPADAALEAHMFAPGRAIGFVRPGQSVLLRYQAYPYQKFGFYGGTVTSVSRAAVNPAEFPAALAGLTSLYGENEPVYRLQVALDRQSVTAYGEELPLQAGFQVEADVLLDTRKLVEWVLDPLYTLTGRS